MGKQFGFRQLREIIPYLSQIGISHIYASPIFKTPFNSENGYRIIDNNTVNEALGGVEEFRETLKEATKHGLGWIQDIVPNHMAFTTENKMITDILKLGSLSKFREFFDIDWNSPFSQLNGKILAPFLDKDYRECLRSGEIKLAFNRGFIVMFHDLVFPIQLSSYDTMINSIQQNSEISFNENESINVAKYGPDNLSSEEINKIIEKYNNDIELLDDLLNQQVFKLDYWKTALHEINYRRFFDIIDLICIREEKAQVFGETHKLIFSLLSEDKLSGLRIDHIDGLHDPNKYLKTLRGRYPDVFIVVEKILAYDEMLRNSWPVQGTSGYDFINLVNGVFVERENEEEFNVIYNDFLEEKVDYNELIFVCKKLVVEQSFGGDVYNLANLLMQNQSKFANGVNCTFDGFRMAIINFICSHNIYRTYLSPEEWLEKDAEIVRNAVNTAKRRNIKVSKELDVIERLLDESRHNDDALGCLMRLQQFTGPVMAKGFEDTALYRFFRFLSLNEVGGNPRKFGYTLDEYHDFNVKRQSKFPFSLNATSTHDTKRGEDTRARMNVLSEIPEEFGTRVNHWATLNADKKKKVQGKLVPIMNEEYMLYQTLLGTLPFNYVHGDSVYIERIQNYMVKAIREGKANSSWLDPNLEYEQATRSFINEILYVSGSSEFMNDFLEFQKQIAFYGAINSLSQTLLKMTCPGVPDFYQGSELWDLSLVDPDNRGPVDFAKRQSIFREILQVREDQPGVLKDLLDGYSDGRVKLFEVFKTLVVRKQLRELFEIGDYLPIEAKGMYENNVVSFCRVGAKQSALIVVPRFPTKLVKMGEQPLGEVWGDTSVCLPDYLSRKWRNVFSGEILELPNCGSVGGLLLSDVFRSFPVALLVSE